MLSAHYFYILSCSVYVSRSLINCNLLRRQGGGKPTLLQGIYTLFYFLTFLGCGEFTFLSISRAGCFMFLCKCLGKFNASLLICHPRQALPLQWTGLKSKRQSDSGMAGQAQPLLTPNSGRDRMGIVPANRVRFVQRGAAWISQTMG